MSTVVLVVEGVLAGRDDDVELAQTPPETAALQLYGAMLAMAGRLVLASNLDRRLLQHWLRAAGMSGYASIVPLGESTVTKLRSTGENVSLYVDHDGERTAYALRSGVPTLLYARPLYARAGHRPDLPQLRRPWAEVIAESRAQREARKAPVLTVEE